MESAYCYFEKNMQTIEAALRSIDKKALDVLIANCAETLIKGNKIVVSGLGKNVPICEKFVGTMISLGLNANFLHTNSAIHGDIGMIHSGDLVIILTKSGSTSETIKLAELLKKRESVKIWLITFNPQGSLINQVKNKVLIELGHEGDLWNIIPNNSTTLNLIILQTIAIRLSEKLGLTLEDDFKPNHPGGAIGERLYNGG